MNTVQLERLEASALESIDNGEPIQVPTMSVGDMLPQGDIGLWKQAERADGVLVEWPDAGDLQLAPGNSRGSRHCVPRKYRGCVTAFRVDDGDPLSDLIIEATGVFDLVHPEHADHIGYGPGIYRVLHQQNQQRERVID